MPTSTAHTIQLKNLKPEDTKIVGSKAANLGTLINASFPVPKGYVITSNVFDQFLRDTGVQDKLSQILKHIDIHKTYELGKASQSCQLLIRNASLTPELRKEIVDSYIKLSGSKSILVAVRSSALAEDLPDASFAGQQDSFMNIKGKQKLIEAVKETWASAFEERAIFYRAQKGVATQNVKIAVVVQQMVLSKTAGVMFTVDPITNNQNSISIEAAYGFGDAVVSGSITPDQYFVQKDNLNLKDKQIVEQSKMLVRSDKAPKNSDRFKDHSQLYWMPVAKAHQGKQKLTDPEIKKLAEIGKDIELYYGWPQDIEWVLSGNSLYIVQTRPVTTIPTTGLSIESEIQKTYTHQDHLDLGDQEHPLLAGLGASQGIASGPVKIINSKSEIESLESGEILVARTTSPEFVTAMRKAVAVVTDLGGRTSHAAIISRELNIPAVVGTELATQNLKNGEIITVNGESGQVFAGKPKQNQHQAKPQKYKQRITSSYRPGIHTATNIFASFPDFYEKDLLGNLEISSESIDGISVIDSENILREFGQHPQLLQQKNKQKELMEAIYDGLMQTAKFAESKPVLYRLADLHTDEYRLLEGGRDFEKKEANPMVGLRGTTRSIADPTTLELELEAIKKARRYHQNIWLVIPFARTPDEFSEIKKMASSKDLYQSGTFKIFLTIDLPSNVILLEKFIGAGVDGVVINADTLTELILGVDSNNLELSHIMSPQDEAVQWAIKHTIEVSKKHGIPTNIYGESLPITKSFIENLVRWGITSITVNQNAIEQVRKLIGHAEFNNVRGR